MQNFNFANMNLKPEDLKQAEHLWKMLDDMYETNPQDYSKFINKQIKDGLEGVKQEREKEIKTMGTKPKVGYLLRMTGKLATMSIEEESKELYSKFLLKKGDQEEQVPDTVKLYLNVCYSEKVLKPLNRTGTMCTNIEDQSSWHDIPISMPEFASSKNQYDGTTSYYFIAILNNELYDFLQKKKGKVWDSLSNYMLEKFQYRLKTDRNPIKNHSSLEFKYYKIDPTSISLRKKKFKVKGLAEPKEVLLDLNADADFYQKKQKIIKEKKEVHLPKQEENTAPKVEIKTTPQQNQAANNKGPLIEELGESLNLPDYVLKDEYNNTIFIWLYLSRPDKYIVEIRLDEDDVAGSFELDASEYCIKLNMNTRKPLELNLKQKIKKDDVEATLKKKKKLLIIEAPKF